MPTSITLKLMPNNLHKNGLLLVQLSAGLLVIGKSHLLRNIRVKVSVPRPKELVAIVWNCLIPCCLEVLFLSEGQDPGHMHIA